MIDNGKFTHGKYAGSVVSAADPAFLSWAIASRAELALTDAQVLELEIALAPPLPPKPAPTLFSVPDLRREIVFTDEQERALDSIGEWIVGGGRFFSLSGAAGVGKTTIVREIVNRYPWVALTAMTGRAALRLSQCAYHEASTLHSALYYPPPPGSSMFTRMREPPSQFVAVDECSLTTPAVLEDLKKWASNGVKILFIGDSFQLPPVISKEEAEKYGDDFSVFKFILGAELTTVMRSAGGVLQAATRVRETGEICRENFDGYEFRRERDPLTAGVEAYLSDPSDHFLITWRNAVRMAANRMIRERLSREGLLPDPGEPVLIRKNGQGFLNGEVIDCGEFTTGPTIAGLRTMWMSTGRGPLLVSFDGGSKERGGEFFDGGNPWVDDLRKYHAELTKNNYPEPVPITWGYCLTAHAVQGGESRRATVFLCRGDDRSTHFRKPTTLPSGRTASFAARWTYTSITRSKKQTTMITG